MVSYNPSFDFYGSYFPAWLICLMMGVILTTFVSLIEGVLKLATNRLFAPSFRIAQSLKCGF
jgi:YtcA family